MKVLGGETGMIFNVTKTHTQTHVPVADNDQRRANARHLHLIRLLRWRRERCLFRARPKALLCRALSVLLLCFNQMKGYLQKEMLARNIKSAS